jgi:hypothetical protein
MPLQLIHPAERRVAYSVAADGPGFGHRLGGGGYAGLVPPAGGPPVQALFRLNTADPAVGVTVPGAGWLPLLVALRYGGCSLGYRVVSDTEVRILAMGETEAWPGFPTPDFPDELPEVPVGLRADGYDPDNPAVAWMFSGLLGTEHLTDEQRRRVAAFAAESGLAAVGWPYTGEPPADPCPDPACANHARPASLRTVALYQAGGRFAQTLWGPAPADVQLVYQMCPACGAITATSRAT